MVYQGGHAPSQKAKALVGLLSGDHEKGGASGAASVEAPPLISHDAGLGTWSRQSPGAGSASWTYNGRCLIAGRSELDLVETNSVSTTGKSVWREVE
jgi:hypothetical protein